MKRFNSISVPEDVYDRLYAYCTANDRTLASVMDEMFCGRELSLDLAAFRAANPGAFKWRGKTRLPKETR